MLFREIADVIGRPPECAGREQIAAGGCPAFGWLAQLVGIDCLGLKRKRIQKLGWRPTHLGLITDLGGEHHFEQIANAASMRR